MAAGLLAGKSAESRIVAIGRIKGKEFSITESRFADEIDQASVEFAERFLFGRKPRPVIFVFVDPFGELRHGPIIEDARPSVVPAEALRAFGRLADFLAVVEHDRAARESIKNGANRPADIHSDAAPFVVRGQPDFVMV